MPYIKGDLLGLWCHIDNHPMDFSFCFFVCCRSKLKSHKTRLLDEEEESVDDLVTRRKYNFSY